MALQGKQEEKDKNHTGKLFRKNMQIKGVRDSRLKTM